MGCSSTPLYALPLRLPRCCAALSSAHLTSSPWQMQTLQLMECGTMTTQLHSWCCTNMARVCGPALQRHRSPLPSSCSTKTLLFACTVLHTFLIHMLFKDEDSSIRLAPIISGVMSVIENVQRLHHDLYIYVHTAPAPVLYQHLVASHVALCRTVLWHRMLYGHLMQSDPELKTLTAGLQPYLADTRFQAACNIHLN